VKINPNADTNSPTKATSKAKIVAAQCSGAGTDEVSSWKSGMSCDKKTDVSYGSTLADGKRVMCSYG